MTDPNKNEKGRLFKAFIGIGTNKGNRKNNIQLVLDKLTKHKEIKIIKVSNMLKNPPQEGIKTGYFLNGAIEILTTLRPEKLLEHCLKIEKCLGRNREEKSRNKKPLGDFSPKGFLFTRL